MIVVLGTVVAGEAHLAEALVLSHEHVARSRTEPGCLSHAVHQDVENANRLVFVERWESKEALLEHFKVPASAAFVKALTGLAAEAPRIDIYDATAISISR